MNFITLPDIGKRIPLLEVSSAVSPFACTLGYKLKKVETVGSIFGESSWMAENKEKNNVESKPIE